MAQLITRRDSSNAAAFVEVTENSVSVRGKFYDEMRGYPGPEIYLGEVPADLLEEIQKISSWRDSLSPELQAFCQKCYEDAANQDDWFSRFVNVANR